MYNFEDYKRIVEEYTGGDYTNKYMLVSAELEKYCNELQKTPIEFEAPDLYKYLIKHGFKSTNSVLNYIAAFKNFYDYLITNRQITHGNVCDDALISANVIVSNSEIKVEFYDGDDINRIVKKMPLSREYYEVIIRSFFEGVAFSPEDLFELRKNDFDYNKKTINTKRGIKIISQELCEAFNVVQNIDYVLNPHPRSRTGVRKIPCEPMVQGGLVPSTGNSKYNITVYLRRASNEAGSPLTMANLYYSGFVNYLRLNIGYDVCNEMFSKRRNTDEENGLLVKAANDYLFYSDPAKIRRSIRPYMIAMLERYCEVDKAVI